MQTASNDAPDPPPPARRWNAYGVGVGIGMLSMAVFWLADKPLGISTALSQASGACAAACIGWDQVAANAYWAKHVPQWDYGMLFLVGTLLGALTAALLGKGFQVEAVPRVWRERFGPAVWKRMTGAVLGGGLMMYGARLAGGCTSGHGISGSLQLAVGSWTFFLVMFATGAATAWALSENPMHVPILTGEVLLAAALGFGFVFGWLLQRGGLTDYNVIVNQFRFRDFTVLKVMLTAVVVGGIGVAALHAGGLANYHIKASPMLAIVSGSALFGAGMVIYGYCPGTALAAVGTGSLHALVGVVGMLLGGMVYALTFPWVSKHVLPLADIGKMTLDQLFGIPVWAVFVLLAVMALGVFALVQRLEKSRR